MRWSHARRSLSFTLRIAEGRTVIAIVLAGGLASRMGGEEKGFLRVGGVPIIERILAALRGQCETIVINANGDPARFAALGCLVVPDTLPDHLGPLAGLLAGFDHVATHHPGDSFVLTVPADAPFLPENLVARLEDRRVSDGAAIVRARSGDNAHGVVALWSAGLREDLRRALIVERLRKVGLFAARYPLATVEWSSYPLDPFLNVNTPDDLIAAESALASLVAGR